MIEILKTKEEIACFLDELDQRNQVDQGIYLNRVQEILEEVKRKKDEALLHYTKMFDDPLATIESLEVSKEEMKQAFDSLDESLKQVLIHSKKRVEEYHQHQKQSTWMEKFSLGETLGQKITPLSSVGVYVPGGKASYPSSVIMNVIPAKVAGVQQVIMTTPASNGTVKQTVLAAAYLCGVDRLFKIGGAQAIAALTYGTTLVPKVDKIVGPGNIYVALAKRCVFGQVGIDSIAGPSEILIVADNTAQAKFCAADLMGQAEHDELASGILITTDEKLAFEVQKEVEEFYKSALRKDILSHSLKQYSKIICVPTLDEAFMLVNKIAPEHLELAIDNPIASLDKVKNAGAIFLGHYTPEALGDYMAGPNHVLPTAKTARFFSPLSVDDFVKKSSILSFTKQSLNALSDDVILFALEEGLQMHAKSIEVRKNQ